MKKTTLIIATLVLLLACNPGGRKTDAFGNFEADELLVSAEAGGKLMKFTPDEGMKLKAGEEVALVDTTQAYLRMRQLETTIQALYKKLPEKGSQLAVYDERIKKLRKEVTRIGNLVSSHAAPQKQLDDLEAELEVTLRQRKALETSLNTQTNGMLAEVEPLRYQLMQAEDQLAKCRVSNPIDGIVLNTMVREAEFVQMGKPLYKIAPLDPIILRAYVVETQLPNVKLGNEVTVRTDAPDGSLVDHHGKVTWVSSEAEFTPKIIQTRDERASQVYAVKIEVPNDGSLKIGMPGEVVF